MADIVAGARMAAVEHDTKTRRPRPGGMRFACTVELVDGPYAGVRYDDPSRLGTGLDIYWAGSGWHAWGEPGRWRLLPETG